MKKFYIDTGVGRFTMRCVMHLGGSVTCYNIWPDGSREFYVTTFENAARAEAWYTARGWTPFSD